MPRPQKGKHLGQVPRPVIYMPAGWTKHNVLPAEISVEDFEVFRLVDAEGCNLDEAAQRMRCSRSTAGRMLERARRILAQALAENAPICIDAGEDSNFSTGPESIHFCGELAVAVDAPSKEAFIAPTFGRAPYFAIFRDHGLEGVRFNPNPGHDKKRYAAQAAVDDLRRVGVCRVGAGRFGPDALRMLAEAGIEALVFSNLSLKDFQAFYLNMNTQ